MVVNVPMLLLAIFRLCFDMFGTSKEKSKCITLSVTEDKKSKVQQGSIIIEQGEHTPVVEHFNS
jgi:hypothetical protein